MYQLLASSQSSCIDLSVCFTRLIAHHSFSCPKDSGLVSWYLVLSHIFIPMGICGWHKIRICATEILLLFSRVTSVSSECGFLITVLSFFWWSVNISFLFLLGFQVHLNASLILFRAKVTYFGSLKELSPFQGFGIIYQNRYKK